MVSKKICLVGAFAVGKTSLVRRFVYDRFDDKYISTIGVKVSRKTVMVPQKTEVTELNMLVWDLAGSEEFSAVRANYMRGSAGAVVVVDVTRPDTLAVIWEYIDNLRSVAPKVAIVMAANKSDVVVDAALGKTVADFADDLAVPLFCTSAKTGENVELMFRRLAMLLLE